MNKKYPPGPRNRLWGILIWGNLYRAPLAFATEVARIHGDFAYTRVGWVRLYFVNRPELIREILATRAKSFRKLGRQMRALSKVEGNGLVVSDGEPWARHRPVVQGAFHARHFDYYARLVVEHTRRRLEGWSPGAVFDLTEEMNQLALEIIAKIVFDVDWSDQAALLRDAIEVIRKSMVREVTSPIVFPDWLPLPGKLRKRRALRTIDNLIWERIRERRGAGAIKKDMLALMLGAAAAGSNGSPITETEIRDEAATLFVAGHDTTSAALAWFWYLLARHPQEEKRVLQEVDAVLGERPATFADLPHLKYTEMVVKESMRLYPAAGFLFGRETVEDVELDGYTLRRGSWVLIAPYIVHRDPRNFKNPEVFDPGRFAPGLDDIPPYAYHPFGGGPRICIGNNMAMMEIVLLAATVLQRFRIVLDQSETEVKAEVEVVLRPKGALRVRALPRHEKCNSDPAACK